MASIVKTEYVINPEYLNAVQSFQLLENSALPPLPANANLDALVNEVAQSIIAANDQKEILSEKAGHELSLREVFYIIAQDLDEGSNRTVTKIQSASSQQITILSHACEKLETMFSSMEKASIQAATILFGINVESPNEMMQKMSADFLDLQAKYGFSVPPGIDITALLQALSMMPAPTPTVSEATPATNPATTPTSASASTEQSPAVAPAQKDA